MLKKPFQIYFESLLNIFIQLSNFSYFVINKDVEKLCLWEVRQENAKKIFILPKNIKVEEAKKFTAH